MTGTRVDSGHAPVLEKPRSFLDIIRKKLGFKRGKKLRQASAAISSDSFTRQTFLECTHSDRHSVDSLASCKICLNTYGSTHSLCAKWFELNSCKCKFCTNVNIYFLFSITLDFEVFG
ncbi:hypothetical protein BpHYR1_036596 [Brachionus plicatilis]|uniref:Uncharacterized protein n=1 Tax=Brachionus plicatilis TaxID=10195 RepID=A0A3M7T3H3_BRAPC|nr:hypothetical protein BpHYR1_036596 [Brachionus plicatilis]